MYRVRAHDEDGRAVIDEEIEGYFDALKRLLDLQTEAVSQGYFYVHGEDSFGNDLHTPLCR